MTDTTSAAPGDPVVSIERVERRVSGLFVMFRDQRIGYDGKPQEVIKRASRGALVQMPKAEAARLDDLGVLAPEGASEQDVAAQIRLTNDQITAAMGRALTMPEAVAIAGAPPPSVTPPSGGLEPVGDYTKGDTGIENTPAPAVVGGPSGMPAPDVAVAPVDEIAAFIEGESPNAPDTVAMAGSDPEHAAKVLEAERLATGNDPRKSVEAPLTKIIEGQPPAQA